MVAQGGRHGRRARPGDGPSGGRGRAERVARRVGGLAQVRRPRRRGFAGEPGHRRFRRNAVARRLEARPRVRRGRSFEGGGGLQPSGVSSRGRDPAVRGGRAPARGGGGGVGSGGGERELCEGGHGLHALVHGKPKGERGDGGGPAAAGRVGGLGEAALRRGDPAVHGREPWARGGRASAPAGGGADRRRGPRGRGGHPFVPGLPERALGGGRRAATRGGGVPGGEGVRWRHPTLGCGPKRPRFGGRVAPGRRKGGATPGGKLLISR
mmetsp:Transcript_36906/g.73126  ORF Transcript_36906/g.73126 Transcript_36906/m.73126 type:complete len:267 (+) Transcript_36906:890-1690(+)